MMLLRSCLRPLSVLVVLATTVGPFNNLVAQTAAPAAPVVPTAPAVPTGIAGPLHLALRSGDAVAWRAAFTSEAVVDARDPRGNTPLHLAALLNRADAVDELLARGADATVTNVAGVTPLHYGTVSERIIRALLKAGAKAHVLSRAGYTPLQIAASRSESLAVVKLLLESGAVINVTRAAGGRGDPLSAAIGGGDRATVALLLEKGADVNRTPGFTPLANAAFNGDVDIVRQLLDRGAEINAKIPFTGNALNTALYAGHTAIATLLVEKGADLNARSVSGHGTPPMVWSAYSETGDASFARLLVQRGVDIETANDDGETAHSWALKRGADTALVRYLREQGAKTPAPARAKAVPSHSLPTDPAERNAWVRASTQRALDVLQRGSDGFLDNSFVQKANCISCHQQTLPAVAFGWARDRGLRVDEVSLGRQLEAQMGMMKPRVEHALQLVEPVPDAPASLGYGLDGLVALRFAPDETTDAMAHYLMSVQRTEGWWPSFDRRPPMEDGPLVATAWAARAVQTYGPKGREREVADVLRRARTWLAQQTPPTQNQRVFQLLGLAWAGEAAAAMQPFARRLMAEQRSDGGWSQLSGLEPDAWATGAALIALHKAGVATNDAAYRRGVDFLLRTQFADGSWWVRSRTWPFQPHFDGRFPHGKDQWISAGGTAWAAMALLLTLDTRATEPVRPGHETLAQFTAGKSVKAPAAAAKSTATSESSPSVSSPPLAQQAGPSFTRDIQPIVERSCAACHGGDKSRGEFSLATREALLKGGASGEPAVVPGRSGESHLLRYVTDQIEDLEMPPVAKREKYPALTADEIARFRAWIDAGAAWE